MASDDLEFLEPLPPFPKCWDYRHGPVHPALASSFLLFALFLVLVILLSVTGIQGTKYMEQKVLLSYCVVTSEEQEGY